MEEKVTTVQTENKIKKVKKKNTKKKKKVKKPYVNPYKTTWGKVIIWVLSAAMVLGTLATLIYLIVINIQKV